MFKNVDVDFFDENGYQIFEDIIPLPLINKIRDVLEADARASQTTALEEMQCAKQEKLLRQLDDMIENDASRIGDINTQSRQTLSGHISLNTRLNPVLREIPYLSSIQQIVKNILKSPSIYMHMPPAARFILPKNNYAAVPAHQDITYNRWMTDFVTMWVPLVDIDDECGGVYVYQGSGFLPEISISTDTKTFWHEGVPTDGYTPIHCKMKKGSILILNRWIIHASAANQSNSTRYSIDYRFFGENDSSIKHYLNMQTGVVIPPN